MIKVLSFTASRAGESSATKRFADMAVERLKEKAALQGETVEYEQIDGSADIYYGTFYHTANVFFCVPSV